MKSKLILLTALLCLAFSVPAGAQSVGSFSIRPQAIDIDASYNGTTIEATGRVPADSEVYLRLLGSSCEVHMKEKGKVFGFMWMNLDSLTFSGLPSVCIVNAAETRPDGEAARSLGLEALEKNAGIESKSLDRHGAFKEFLKLKEQEGLYRQVGGAVAYGPVENGEKTFSAQIPVPSRISPGDYIVELFTVQNGSIVNHSEQKVPVKLVGAPEFLANLAFGHGALYGILATLIALISGLGIGLLFPEQGIALGKESKMNILDGLKSVANLWPRPKIPVPFPVLFKKFKSILERNNRILELMADMGDKMGGEYIFDRQYIFDTCERLNDCVFKLISDLCVLNQRKNLELFVAFERIQHQVQEELAGRHTFPMSKPVILLDEITLEHQEEVGNKFASLGDIRNTLCLPTMDGFVITTKTFFDFMEYNDLLKSVQETLDHWDGEDRARFSEMCREVQQQILDAEVPRTITSHVNAMVDIIAGRHREGKPLRFAVRSSAWGEDGEFSFAGQYESLLSIAGSDIIEAYKHVIAGAYSPEAWQYRLHRGYREHEMAMAVGCQVMVEAASSGVMYTYAPIVSEKESMVISGAWGLGPAVVEGTAESDTFVLDREPPFAQISVDTGHKASKIVSNPRRGTIWRDVPEPLRDVACLTADQTRQLAQYGMILERYYRRPQDVEWAFDSGGNLFILQSRPLRIRPSEMPAQVDDEAMFGQLVFSGKGITVQEGIGSGKVMVVRKDQDLEDFPHGAILVAKYTSPKYSRVMNKAAGIITDIGSATGHMATLAREYRVPSIVNAEVAMDLLATGDEIILDAGQKKVYRGVLKGLGKFEINGEEIFEDSYEYRLLKRLIKKTNKLYLIDPQSEDFNPGSCRTYHDITRYIHEKAVEKLIDLSENYRELHSTVPRRLESDIPLGLLVINIEESSGGARVSKPIRIDEITSVPMIALIEGLSERGMWDSTPVSVDIGSFMSSFTRTFSASLADPERVGRNLAVISKEYLNLNLRLGYHFNVVDAYISESINDNYIYFRFFGGVTEATRRSRRARFIAEVLERFDFRVDLHGDMVVGRMKKNSKKRMLRKMRLIGALIGYTRQLDVLMNDECRVAQYLEDFTQRIQPLMEAQHG